MDGLSWSELTERLKVHLTPYPAVLSIGGLLVVLAASTIGVFARRRNAQDSGTSPIEASTQPENSNAQIEPYAPSPAIAIAEDVFGRELEEEVAALNATQDEAAAQDSPPGEARPGAPQNEAHGAEKSFAEAEASETPPAKQMGRYVARVTDASTPPPLRYRHMGDLATIGRNAAVVKLGRLELTGFLGWLFWSVVHIYFLIGRRNRFVVAATWLYITFQRGARLITEVPPPRTLP